MPEGGRHSGVERPVVRRRPKLSPLERYHRGRVIGEMRSRENPVAWKDIAREVGMSQSGAKGAYADFLDWEEPLHDPMDVVQETIDALTVSMHEALRTYEAAPEGSSIRVQALKVGMEAAITRLNVLRAAGRAPRSLAAPAVAQQMQIVFREFADLLRRHNVGEDALVELLGLAESQIGHLPSVNSSARLSSAA